MHTAPESSASADKLPVALLLKVILLEIIMLETQLLFPNFFAPGARAFGLSFEFRAFKDDYSGRLLGPRCRDCGEPSMAPLL